MDSQQRQFTREFKLEAVRLLQSSGKSGVQVAKDLGISDSVLYRWRKQFSEQGHQAFPGHGHQTELEEENRRLKRELERVQQEREILKKVLSIFSRESK